MTKTDDDTTGDKDTDVSTRRKRLHEGSDDDKNRSGGHADATSSVISEWSTEEETSHDSSNGVSRVDRSDGIGIGVVEVGDPVLRTLDSVED